MEMTMPRIIQGGMGLGVSNWPLARAVSLTGQLGVVSLVAAPMIVARTLEDGDPGGHIQRAFSHFPVPEYAERVLKQYYRPEGRKGRPYKKMPTASLYPGRELEELAAVTCFTIVWLAKEGHDGLIGVNLLEKIQMTHPATVFGAMLAGLDVLIVGAGIPDQFPAMLTGLTRWERVAYRVAVKGTTSQEEFSLPFDPNVSFSHIKRELKRPTFLAIISSNLLANFLVGQDKQNRVDGFIVETPTAGGHNAPPRGRMKLNERGEPIYGPRDEMDFEKLKALGVPFYCAGSFTSAEKAKKAIEVGAVGIQAGSIFALCEESGFREDLKVAARRLAYRGELDVFTDPVGSPSGFPFKSARVAGTVAFPEVYAERRRVCNIGGFKEPCKTESGEIVYRCPAEPEASYVKLGGKLEETVGKKCLCNGLLAAVGLAQKYSRGYVEPALMTMGDDTAFVRHLMKHENDTWTARQGVEYLLSLLD